ncbi:unnamed protein product [Ciceribacter selenitireducens ATCC BAA-1503]|uniref:Uncharacterized protein n=1 Tax=Ciceribacter selenitireducens ATCC BAA-1503 TaxID=1336235 RepID=A0A376ABJ0_9HYPH|nr:unnamed protein product [Ciceribacter selenitireducens ATCC BAA-1503]
MQLFSQGVAKREFGDITPNSLRRPSGIATSYIRQEDDELLSTPTTGKIVISDRTSDDLSKLTDDGISGVMSVGIVD